MLGFPGFEAEVTRSKVEFLVEKWIVRNVHFPILTEIGAISIDDCGCVMVEAGSAFLEKRRDDYHLELFGNPAQTSRRRPGNLLSEPKIAVIFNLAKIDRSENLLEAN